MVCVLYRYDERTRQRVAWQESELRHKVKGAGRKSEPVKRDWKLCRERAEDLDLESGIVEGAI